jgi:hypothetical protein
MIICLGRSEDAPLSHSVSWSKERYAAGQRIDLAMIGQRDSARYMGFHPTREQRITSLLNSLGQQISKSIACADLLHNEKAPPIGGAFRYRTGLAQ